MDSTSLVPQPATAVPPQELVTLPTALPQSFPTFEGPVLAPRAPSSTPDMPMPLPGHCYVPPPQPWSWPGRGPAFQDLNLHLYQPVPVHPGTGAAAGPFLSTVSKPPAPHPQQLTRISTTQTPSSYSPALGWIFSSQSPASLPGPAGPAAAQSQSSLTSGPLITLLPASTPALPLHLPSLPSRPFRPLHPGWMLLQLCRPWCKTGKTPSSPWRPNGRGWWVMLHPSWMRVPLFCGIWTPVGWELTVAVPHAALALRTTAGEALVPVAIVLLLLMPVVTAVLRPQHSQRRSSRDRSALSRRPSPAGMTRRLARNLSLLPRRRSPSLVQRSSRDHRMSPCTRWMSPNRRGRYSSSRSPTPRPRRRQCSHSRSLCFRSSHWDRQRRQHEAEQLFSGFVTFPLFLHRVMT